VTIPADQFTALQALQQKVTELEAENARREAAAREEQVKLLTQKGEAEAAVKTLREQKEAELAAERLRLSQTEERAKRYALEGELSRALAAQPLVSPAAAQQLASLFRSELQVHAESDGFVVRTPTFQSAADFVRERLTKPEFAHFVKAGSQGGATGQTTQAIAAPANPARDPTAEQQLAAMAAANPNMSMGEKIIVAAKLGVYPQATQLPAGTAAIDMKAGFGLRRSG
jgi:hypothetical protein